MTTAVPILIQTAMAAYQAGDWVRAAQACDSVLRQDPSERNALLMLGAIRAQSGETPAAIDLLERARTVAPSDIHVLTNLGAAYRTAGRLSDARAALEAACAIDRRFAPALFNLGNTLSDLGDRAGAKSAFERVLVLQPSNADAMANLGDIAEREHRLDDAIRLTDRALVLEPLQVTASLARARVELRKREYASALARLGKVVANETLSLVNRAVTEGLIGQAAEKLGDYRRAFASFKKANKILFELNAPAFAADRGPASLDAVKRMTAFAEKAQPTAWSKAPPSVRSPVFLVGFPRSGTTLLDQVLASHPNVTTLEERDVLFAAASPLFADNATLARLPQLSVDEIEACRAHYWSRVDGLVRAGNRAGVFVDKMPLNTILLPVIYRLFPDARILFAVRDPRDVVISCFQQRFGMNAAMFQLLQLDTAVRYYDAVMRLGQTARAVFPLKVHDVKYEALTADFDATIGAALSFLGLEWNDAVRDYAATARQRTIATPSASQVVEPLYATSQGKWRNYAKELEPYLPALAPWVKAFGYTES
ncbi:MAG: tetratricopeptide repeat protein [Alphaproteobacteria bacterium]|nr:tetratricopeptide repeat protein [Alphaproteobacteria bacterium]